MSERSFELRVNAAAKWQDAQIGILAGGWFSVAAADGRVSVNPNFEAVDFSGAPHNRAAKFGYVLSYAHQGCLVARIGLTGTPFRVQLDKRYAGRHYGTGAVQFIVNDDIDQRYGDGFADNTGHFLVRGLWVRDDAAT